MLAGPGHEEKGHAGQDGAEHIQGHHDQDQAEQAVDALVVRQGGEIRGCIEAVPGVGAVNQAAGEA